MSKNKAEDIITENEKNSKLYMEFYKLVKIYEYLYTKVSDPKEKVMFKHKIISLRNSSKQIKNYKDEIENGKDLEELTGIGKGTISRIDEFLKNKKLEEITNFCDQNDCNDIFASNTKKNIYEDLITVFGIGDKLAKKLIEKYNLKSVKELQKLVSSNKIELPISVITGLKYFGKVKNAIPRSEITQIREYIYETFQKLDPNLVFDICGSFRRKRPTSNDIDLLVTSYENKSDNLTKIVNELTKEKFIIERLSGEDSKTKFMGLCQYKNNSIRRLDIRYVDIESFFPAYLYFTGSYEFNERMRGIAKRQNYKLNEYGLYKLDGSKEKLIKIYSEKDVFDILGMNYLEPWERI
jgi:DNA polymerase/3'-5' exonuclease PolX